MCGPHLESNDGPHLSSHSWSGGPSWVVRIQRAICGPEDHLVCHCHSVCVCVCVFFTFTYRAPTKARLPIRSVVCWTAGKKVKTAQDKNKRPSSIEPPPMTEKINKIMIIMEKKKRKTRTKARTRNRDAEQRSVLDVSVSPPPPPQLLGGALASTAVVVVNTT